MQVIVALIADFSLPMEEVQGSMVGRKREHHLFQFHCLNINIVIVGFS